MTDPELQAAMQVLSVVTPASYFTDIHLFCSLVCRMANFSMQHGMSGASAHGYAHLGEILGPVFHRYSEGYRFAKLACDLVEKHGFIAYQAKAYDAMSIATQWTQSITTAIDFMRASFRAAIETGDLTYACYGMFLSRPRPSRAQRSARRGVARVGDGVGLRPEGRVPRCLGRHPEPAALYRDHAGPDLRPSPPSATRSSTRRRSRPS